MIPTITLIIIIVIIICSIIQVTVFLQSRPSSIILGWELFSLHKPPTITCHD